MTTPITLLPTRSAKLYSTTPLFVASIVLFPLPHTPGLLFFGLQPPAVEARRSGDAALAAAGESGGGALYGAVDQWHAGPAAQRVRIPDPGGHRASGALCMEPAPKRSPDWTTARSSP